MKIKNGTFFFNQGHLKLVNQHFPNSEIKIVGKGVTLVPKGWLLKDGDDTPCEVNGESCFLDLKHKKSLSPWGEVMYADSLIEIIDMETKRCRLKCKKLGDLKVAEGNMAYLDLTRWCRCYQYKVLKIENGYVDFYAHDLALDNIFHKPEYNVNYDYIYAKANPRFRLCNVGEKRPVSVWNKTIQVTPDLNSVYLSDVTTFLVFQNSELSQMVIQGITFLGSKASDLPLLYYKGAKASNIEFENCKFVGQRSRIISLNATDNLYFHNNYVTDNYEWGIVSLSNSSNTVVENNFFENNGTGLSYARCVTCFGKDYYVGHNIFKNFGYCAISVGTPYGTMMENPAKGIIEYNNIYFDQEYFSNAWKYTIMDSGAIYVWTQNENCIIRYNYVHDYTGMRQNRGIYCDDGASGVKIYGNIVMNIPNWHAIDSRRVPNTEKANNKISFSERNNLNNVILYNITDGTINLVGREQEDNGCMKGGNVFLSRNGERTTRRVFKTTYNNLDIEGTDMNTQYDDYNSKGIIIQRKVADNLKDMPCYDKIKRYLRKR